MTTAMLNIASRMNSGTAASHSISFSNSFIGLNSMSRPRRGKAATWRYPNKDGSVQFGFDLVIKTGRPFRELGVDLFSKSLERSAVDIDDLDTGFLHLF